MKSRGAFTLIELLVVIAIIAILAAILFPVFAQAKLAAQKTSSLSNMKQMGISIALYTNDSDDLYPTSWNGAPNWGWQNSWPWLVQPYVKNMAIFASQADTVSVEPGSGPRLSVAGNGILAGQCVGGWRVVLVGLLNPQFGWYPDLTNVTKSNSSVGRPSETILVAQRFRMPRPWDGAAGKGGASAAWGAYYTSMDIFDTGDGGLMGQRNGIWGAPDGAYLGIFPAPYSNKSNFVFADTSAKSMNPIQTVNTSANNAGGCVEANYWKMWDANRVD